MKKNESISLDQIQLYIAKGVILHPTLRQLLDELLWQQEQKQNLRLLPTTTLIMYNRKLKKFKRSA